MANRTENMRRGPSKGRSKVCIQCNKEFILATEKADAKLRYTKKATSRFINEEGGFSCGNHQRDELCNDCFQIAVDHEKEQQRRRRIMDGAAKRIWRKIYLKEGDEVPWSKEEEEEIDEDEEEDDDVPLDNAQQQTKQASASSLSQQKTCAHCGKIGNFDRCAKCKVVYYCSRSHQAADYAKHKTYCQAPTTPLTHMTQQLNIADGDEATNPPAVTSTPKEDTNGGPSAGNNGTPNEKPPITTWLICALCGTKSEKLSKCSRCKCTWYCSADHQRAHFPEHKFHCKFIADAAATAAQPPAVPHDLGHPHIWANRTVCLHNRNIVPKESPVISWSELGGIHPNVAIGRTLEVRLVPDSTGIMEKRYEGKDAEGVVRVVAFYTFRPPAGLKKGCVLRWRNPWFHRFAHDGSHGANIEDWDLPNVTVSAA
ncbi:hypothetical protein KC19_2G090900 [Ceratodon purpureus]|uniref:MYND-type domain-containing protein n=1 Tax=Ceratodon purpureus TaxID=3225 RepID=A0A8T0ITF9_CERPU|nr:hypothetical protein KC19_2G090900 [Ceratodon purpureus]